jgi:hypothetical protein
MEYNTQLDGYCQTLKRPFVDFTDAYFYGSEQLSCYSRLQSKVDVTNRVVSVIMPENECIKVSQMWSGHRQRAGSARRAGHEPRQGSGGAAERQEGRLAEGQTEEADTYAAGPANRQAGRPAVKVG